MTIGTIKYSTTKVKRLNGEPFAYECPWGKLPEVSQINLATGGLAHALGNVVSSAVNLRIRERISDLENGKQSDVTTAQVKDFRESNKELVTKWHEEEFKDAVEDLENGTMGTSERGPRIDPVEREYRQLVEKAAIGALAAYKLLLPEAPKKGQAPKTVTFADGTVMTREKIFEMIRTSKKPEYVNLHKQAEQTVAARDRLAAAKQADGEATVANLF